MAKKTVKDIDLKDKKVLVRIDFNAPLKDGVITNSSRIVVALPIIKYVIENGGKTILFSYLGCVKAEEGKTGESLKSVVERLSELLDQPVTFVPETRGKELEDAVNNMKGEDVLVFENIRSEDVDSEKESSNDAELGKYWAFLGDVFVNGAFGTAHRAHASNVGTASTGIPTVAGFLMEKEVKFISEAIENPKHLFAAILGGAKVSDKVTVIENLIGEADKILISGDMAYTFMKAQGYGVGLSSLEEDRVDLAKSLMKRAGNKLVLLVDTIAPKGFSNDAPFHTVPLTKIPDDEEGLDTDEKTIELPANELQGARTVVWNGSTNVFEMSNFAKGTIGVCEAIASLEGVTTIIGGRGSTAAAIQLGHENKFSHISTGGGASSELLEGKTLSDLASINDK